MSAQRKVRSVNQTEQENGAAQAASVFPLLEPSSFVAMNTRNLEFAARTMRAFMTSAAEMNREMASFIKDRLEKDVEAARTLVTSKSVGHAQAVQAEFLETALADYAQCSKRLLGIAGDAARESMHPDGGAPLPE